MDDPGWVLNTNLWWADREEYIGRMSIRHELTDWLRDKLARLGISREQDLVLHLPLRYEDHTHLCPLAALKPGQAWQVEGTVANSEVQYRGRRQLVPTAF